MVEENKEKGISDEVYEAWKERINNNPEVKKRGEMVGKITELKPKKIFSNWWLIKDILVLILILGFLILVGVYIFFPESYQSLTTNICNPTINNTFNIEPDIYNVSNYCGDCNCPNIKFPEIITIDIVNNTN